MTEIINGINEEPVIQGLTPESEDTAAEETAEQADSPDIDYDADVLEIVKALPELSGTVKDLSENRRYSELRALGLSPKEAYLATSPAERRSDSRSHLTGSFPKAATSPSFAMPKEELAIARSLFEDLDDGEIRKLYKKVTK